MNQLFDADQIQEINVRPNDLNRQAEVIIIQDRKKIKTILAIMNEGSEEAIKFYPKWHLIIIDSNKKEHLVMSSENEVKYNGKVYRLRTNIKQALFD